MHGSASIWLHSSRGQSTDWVPHDQEEAYDVGIGYQSGNPWLEAPSWGPSVTSPSSLSTDGCHHGLRGGLLSVTSHLAHWAVPLCRWQRAHAPGSTSAKKQLKCLYSPREAGRISGVTLAVSLSGLYSQGCPLNLSLELSILSSRIRMNE